MYHLCCFFKQKTAYELRIIDCSSDVCSSDLTCRLLGIEIERHGQPSDRHPTLYVANHVSYLDIEVLGALLKASFVAKAEVATWPFFAWLARLQETVFVERRVRHAAQHRDEMARRLDAGDDLILFPEGTSGDGTAVLSFKSALFSAAARCPPGNPVPVPARKGAV